MKSAKVEPAWPVRFVRGLVVFGSSLLLGSILLFGLFELLPGMIEPLGLGGIRYLGIRSLYAPDPNLVFVPRTNGGSFEEVQVGDLFSTELGIEPPFRRVSASFNEYGFRSNSSTAPFEVVLLGDSYLAVGDEDGDTLSERLRQEAGTATFNLGREWYGPEQYLELFRQFDPKLNPGMAILCFFAGNDLEDLRQYESWRQGGEYYDFGVTRQNAVLRYRSAVRDTGDFLLASGERLWASFVARLWKEPDFEAKRLEDPRFAVIDLAGRPVASRVGYIPEEVGAGRLLASWDGQRLRALLEEFQLLSAESSVRPFVLYIPTKFQVYRPHFQEGTSAQLLALPGAEASAEFAAHEAILQISADAGLEVLDLYPVFRKAAGQGELLYHPFDSHWNSRGRQLAAETIASGLTRSMP